MILVRTTALLLIISGLTEGNHIRGGHAIRQATRILDRSSNKKEKKIDKHKNDGIFEAPRNEYSGRNKNKTKKKSEKTNSKITLSVNYLDFQHDGSYYYFNGLAPGQNGQSRDSLRSNTRNSLRSNTRNSLRSGTNKPMDGNKHSRVKGLSRSKALSVLLNSPSKEETTSLDSSMIKKSNHEGGKEINHGETFASTKVGHMTKKKKAKDDHAYDRLDTYSISGSRKRSTNTGRRKKNHKDEAKSIERVPVVINIDDIKKRSRKKKSSLHENEKEHDFTPTDSPSASLPESHSGMHSQQMNSNSNDSVQSTTPGSTPGSHEATSSESQPSSESSPPTFEETFVAKLPVLPTDVTTKRLTTKPEDLGYASSKPPAFDGSSNDSEEIVTDCSAISNGNASIRGSLRSFNLKLNIIIDNSFRVSGVTSQIRSFLQKRVAPQIAGCSVKQGNARKNFRKLTETDIINVLFFTPSLDSQAACSTSESRVSCYATETNVAIYLFDESDVTNSYLSDRLTRLLKDQLPLPIPGLRDIRNIKVGDRSSSGVGTTSRLENYQQANEKGQQEGGKTKQGLQVAGLLFMVSTLAFVVGASAIVFSRHRNFETLMFNDHVRLENESIPATLDEGDGQIDFSPSRLESMLDAQHSPLAEGGDNISSLECSVEPRDCLGFSYDTNISTTYQLQAQSNRSTGAEIHNEAHLSESQDFEQCTKSCLGFSYDKNISTTYEQQPLSNRSTGGKIPNEEHHCGSEDIEQCMEERTRRAEAFSNYQLYSTESPQIATSREYPAHDTILM